MSLTEFDLRTLPHALINIGKQQTEILGPLLLEEGRKLFDAFPFRSKKTGHHPLYKTK